MSEFLPEWKVDLRQKITEHKLDGAADAICANADECYAMVIDGNEDYAATGNTRFGGEPDLPASIPWPTGPQPFSDRTHFSNFIAQINFAELPKLSAAALPASGLLYLFVRYMECAAEPVLMDAIYFDGDLTTLRRTSVPDPDLLADEYLVDLQPLKMRAVPAVGVASYRKKLRAAVDSSTATVDDKTGELRFFDLERTLQLPGQIGQLLGFANAGGGENLYRQLFLARIGKRQLTYNDYWESMEEYEAYMKFWGDQGNHQLVEMYQGMRPGVTWLVNNADMIAKGVAEWRLLFRIDSNVDMNLTMMDWDPLYVFIREESLANRNFTDLAGEVTQG